MTWGRKNGDDLNCPINPWVCTYEGMDDSAKESILFMANTHKTEVAPASAVWRYLRTNNPSIELYNIDETHPSVAGSYAVACAFYIMIFKKDPTLITWNSTLSATDANIIKAAAKTIVYNQIPSWDFTINPAVANFSSVINSNQVSFTNTSDAYDTLLWNFGDGITSTEANPTHTYSTSGGFDASLTVYKCGKQNVKTKNINIISLNSKTIDKEFISMHMNPESNQLNIHLNKTYNTIHLNIFDVTGKSVIKKNAQNADGLSFNLSSLQSGIYVVKLVSNGEIINTSKIVKY
jgi:PKD repeat protein